MSPTSTIGAIQSWRLSKLSQQPKRQDITARWAPPRACALTSPRWAAKFAIRSTTSILRTCSWKFSQGFAICSTHTNRRATTTPKRMTIFPQTFVSIFARPCMAVTAMAVRENPARAATTAMWSRSIFCVTRATRATSAAVAATTRIRPLLEKKDIARVSTEENQVATPMTTSCREM